MIDAYAIRDFYRLLIRRTDLSPAALQVVVSEYATQICKTDEAVQEFVTTVYGDPVVSVDPPAITRADIERMKRDGYLGAGWAR